MSRSRGKSPADKQSGDNARLVGGEDDVEAEQEEEGADLITEPFDPAKIRVTSWEPTVELLLKRIQNNEIDIGPAFQRRGGIWSNGAQSRLIESLLIRIPLPSFYMDATDEDKLLVVDGQQRLTALKRFMLDKTLRLEGLEFLKLKDKSFDELPRKMQRRIEETQVTVFLIEKGTPSGVKFNIFKRINTGGMQMSPQEIRHAMNDGPALEFLRTLAESPDFLKATSGSVLAERMADRECVLRFCAFATTDIDKYSSKDLDPFLNDKMGEINRMSQVERTKLSKRFKRAMLNAYKVLGSSAFRKQVNPEKGRNPFNKALFEAWSVNFDRLSDTEIDLVVKRRDVVLREFTKLMKDPEFDVSVTAGTGSPPKVRRRFNDIRDLLIRVLS
jgi:hypothetical protein